jgi:hypothetical protein
VRAQINEMLDKAGLQLEEQRAATERPSGADSKNEADGGNILFAS